MPVTERIEISLVTIGPRAGHNLTVIEWQDSQQHFWTVIDRPGSHLHHLGDDVVMGDHDLVTDQHLNTAHWKGA